LQQLLKFHDHLLPVMTKHGAGSTWDTLSHIVNISFPVTKEWRAEASYDA